MSPSPESNLLTAKDLAGDQPVQFDALARTVKNFNPELANEDDYSAVKQWFKENPKYKGVKVTGIPDAYEGRFHAAAPAGSAAPVGPQVEPFARHKPAPGTEQAGSPGPGFWPAVSDPFYKTMGFPTLQEKEEKWFSGAESLPARAAARVTENITGAAESFLSPIGMATLGMGGAVKGLEEGGKLGQAAAGLYKTASRFLSGAMALKSSADAAQHIQKYFTEKQDPGELVEAAADVPFIIAGGYGAKKGFPKPSGRQPRATLELEPEAAPAEAPAGPPPGAPELPAARSPRQLTAGTEQPIDHAVVDDIARGYSTGAPADRAEVLDLSRKSLSELQRLQGEAAAWRDRLSRRLGSENPPFPDVRKPGEAAAGTPVVGSSSTQASRVSTPGGGEAVVKGLPPRTAREGAPEPMTPQARRDLNRAQARTDMLDKLVEAKKQQMGAGYPGAPAQAHGRAMAPGAFPRLAEGGSVNLPEKSREIPGKSQPRIPGPERTPGGAIPSPGVSRTGQPPGVSEVAGEYARPQLDMPGGRLPGPAMSPEAFMEELRKSPVEQIQKNVTQMIQQATQQASQMMEQAKGDPAAQQKVADYMVQAKQKIAQFQQVIEEKKSSTAPKTKAPRKAKASVAKAAPAPGSEPAPDAKAKRSARLAKLSSTDTGAPPLRREVSRILGQVDESGIEKFRVVIPRTGGKELRIPFSPRDSSPADLEELIQNSGVDPNLVKIVPDDPAFKFSWQIKLPKGGAATPPPGAK